MMLVGMGSFSFLIAGDTPTVPAAAEWFLTIGRAACGNGNGIKFACISAVDSQVCWPWEGPE